MPFIKISTNLTEAKKAFKVVLDMLACDMKTAQKHIDKQRLLCNGEIVKNKSSNLTGKIDLLTFSPITKGLLPIFKTKNFVLFDKPSGLLVHPKSRSTPYSLTDEVKFQFGDQANIVHRIDMETSGLVLVARHKKAEIYLKNSFQNKRVKKGYEAIVKGKILSPMTINEPIKLNRDFSQVKIKVSIDKRGKNATTIIKPISYDIKSNTTLVEAVPLTGRQHQIRVHLFHVKHPIIGDPIYGTTYKEAADYLDGKLSDKSRVEITGAKRLMLHAKWIEFFYENRFKIYSQSSF